MNEVWEHSAHKGSSLLLLLSIADHADDNGTAYPGIERLARKTRLTVRNVQYLLAQITKTPELEIQHGAGPHGTNLYQLRVGAITGATPPDPQAVVGAKPGVKTLHPRKPASKGGEIQRAKFHPNHQEPSSEPSEDREREAGNGELFDTTPKSELPPPLDRPDVLEAWTGYKQMRARKRAHLTPLALSRIIQDLLAMGPDGARDSLWQSARKCWTDIYPVKPKGGTDTTTTTTKPTITKKNALA